MFRYRVEIPEMVEAVAYKALLASIQIKVRKTGSLQYAGTHLTHSTKIKEK